ncbi:MAG: hypothetical protein KAH57_04495 [Thermoplasmata archaeon]|nr:hypothetical protein [Thermoplasmata archaeon]
MFSRKERFREFEGTTAEGSRKKGFILLGSGLVCLLIMVPAGVIQSMCCLILFALGMVLISLGIAQLKMGRTEKSLEEMYAEYCLFMGSRGDQAFRDMPDSVDRVLKGSLNEPGTKHMIMGGVHVRDDVIYRTGWWKGNGFGTKSNDRPIFDHLVTVVFVGKFRGSVTFRPGNPVEELLIRDIDFEDRKFSNWSIVQANPRRLAYDFFHPRMIELFKKERRFSMTLHDGWMILHERVKRASLFDPDSSGKKYDLTQLAEWIEGTTTFLPGVYQLIPTYMKEEEAVAVDEVEYIDPSIFEDIYL